MRSERQIASEGAVPGVGKVFRKGPVKNFGRSSRALSGISLLVVLAALIAGCGGGGSSSSGSGATGSSESGSTESAAGGWAEAKVAAEERVQKYTEPISSLELTLPKVPGGSKLLSGKKILVVPLSNTIFATTTEAIKAIVQKAGGSAQICDGKLNPTEIAKCMASAKTSGDDAVIAVTISPETAAESYKELEAASIPVFAAWQNPQGTEETKLLRFFDNIPAEEAGLEVATDYAMASSEEPLQAQLIGVSDSKPVEEASENWFSYTEKVCSECSQDNELVLSANAPQVTSMVSSQLIKNPNTNSIMLFNVDGLGPPALEGLANSAAQPTLGGAGSGGASLKLIKQGRVGFVSDVSEYVIGYAAVDGLLREMAEVEPVEYSPFPIRLFDSENVAELDLTPQAEKTFEWFGPAPVAQEFEEAWGS